MSVSGEITYKFDHNRDGLVDKSMIFQYVGNKQAGGMRPGKVFAMNVMTDILVKCGKTRCI